MFTAAWHAQGQYLLTILMSKVGFFVKLILPCFVHFRPVKGVLRILVI